MMLGAAAEAVSRENANANVKVRENDFMAEMAKVVSRLAVVENANQVDAGASLR